MAKLTVKITNTGEEFEIFDVDLNQLTPRQLFAEMVRQGLLPAGPIAGHYTVAENGGYPPTQNGDIRSLFWLFSLMALQN